MYADLGLDEKGGINWDAPLFRRNGLKGLPYYYVLDGSGERLREGSLDDVTQFLQAP